MTNRPYQAIEYPTITRDEYLAALDRLGLSQVGAAPVFKLSRRQAQRLASGAPVPPLIATVIRLLLRRRLRLSDLE